MAWRCSPGSSGAIEIGAKAEELKGQFRSFSERAPRFHREAHGFRGRTGNAAFDEYREQELKRLEEERRKLEAMRAEFESFLRSSAA